jgi:hypothetical protein
MSYLICDQCGACYELDEGESADDFELACECGGQFKYVESLNGPKSNSKFSFKEMKTRNKFILAAAIIVIIIFSSIMTINSYFPNTETPDGYLTYINNNLPEYNDVAEYGARALEDYNNHLISSYEAINRLESTQTKLNRISSEFARIKYPPVYKKHHDLTVSAHTDFSAGISQDIIAIKTGNPEAVDNAVYYFKSSLTKTEQARDEIVRINNL